jgi:phosphonate transport system substrate-binding protein
MKKYLSLFLLSMIVFTLTACGAATDEGAEDGGADDAAPKEIESLTMGFIPSQEADKIADTVEPLEQKLSEKLGVPVEAEVMIDFVGLVEGMRTGQIDIGFINPFGYVQAVDRANVEIVAKAIRHGSDSYQAQFIAQTDSELESVEDLVNNDGLTWAFPDTLSTSGFLFPAAQLMDLGVEDLSAHFTQTSVGGHDNAVLAVLDGQADFATTFDDARTIVQEDYPDVMDRVKVLGKTEAIPNDGVAVSQEVPDEWKDKIREAFLALNEDEDALKIMENVYSWTGIAEASDEEYDIVREVYSKFEDQLAQ